MGNSVGGNARWISKVLWSIPNKPYVTWDVTERDFFDIFEGDEMTSHSSMKGPCQSDGRILLQWDFSWRDFDIHEIWGLPEFLWETKKPDSICLDTIIPSLRPHLISLLIPHAVGEDKHNNGHLAEPYEDPEPRYLNPNESWRLQLKGAHCNCRESLFLQLSEKGPKNSNAIILHPSTTYLLNSQQCLNVHLDTQWLEEHILSCHKCSSVSRHLSQWYNRSATLLETKYLSMPLNLG